MNKYNSFTPVSFAEVYKYIDKTENKRLQAAMRHIIGIGCLLFPVYIMKISGIPEPVIADIATGATLAGAGVGKIIGDAVRDLIKVFPGHRDYKAKYMRLQTAYYLTLYAAFYEAAKDLVNIEGCDIWEKYQSSVKLSQKDIFSSVNGEYNDVRLFVCSIDELKIYYEQLTDELKKHTFSLGFLNSSGDDADEQRKYLSDIFNKLPGKALEIFGMQISDLSEQFPSMKNWILQDSLNTLKSQASDIYNTLTELSPKSNAEKKDLYAKYKNDFYSFFHNSPCRVDNLFTEANYSIGSISSDKTRDSVHSLEDIMDIASQQGCLLVTGPYGSGKTILLKALHMRYRAFCSKVYAYEAHDLTDYINTNSADKLCDFFGSLCAANETTTILIDSIDDLNIPSSESSEKSILYFFIDNLFECIRRYDNIVFIVTSRLYASVDISQKESVAEIFYSLSLPEMNEMKIVYSGTFNADTVSKWIDHYPFQSSQYTVNKTIIKDNNKKIAAPLSNPLFLYVFIRKYEETLEIKLNEGYYYYYEHFIDQTIKGKYRSEARLGAPVIQEHTQTYRDLLQKIAFNILKKHSDQISSVIVEKQLYTTEPLLAEELRDYKFSMSLSDFSEDMRACFNKLQAESIDQANFLNCYFLKMISGQIFFTDVNILFVLASERIFAQLCRIIKDSQTFHISDLDKLDVIDFYPQVLDYVLYKIQNSKNIEAFEKYACSFVLNDEIRRRIIMIEDNSRNNPKETFAQVIMMYVIFFKLNTKNYGSNSYGHIFKEMMYFVNAYKTYTFNQGKRDRIYTVERFFMNISLNTLTLKRLNLSHFNFSNSVISRSNFFQCKFEDTLFNNTVMKGKNRFELCVFEKSNLLLSNSNACEINFSNCQIKSLNLKPLKCKFTQCYIQRLDLYLQNLVLITFEDCIINTVIIQNEHCSGKANIEFSNCIFKTEINVKETDATILLKGKCYYSGKGSLFKNPNKLSNPEMIL